MKVRLSAAIDAGFSDPFPCDVGTLERLLLPLSDR
jgi:hypothetical protein